MMYKVSRKEAYKKEIEEALSAKTKNSNYIETAMNMSYSFPNVISELLERSKDLRSKLKMLEKNGLLAHDDYSIAVHE